MKRKTRKRKPKILAVIPARGGSKSVPRKNIKPLAGKPLLAHMLQAARRSTYVTRVVVSSEDKEILQVAKRYGGNHVVLKRPKKFATDSSPSLPVIQHAVREIEKEEGQRFDYVVMLQPTTPLTSSKDIDGALKKLIRPGVDSVMSVYQVNDSHPVKMKRIAKNDRLVQYIRNLKETQFTRQKLDSVYKRNGAIYASRRDIIMKKGRLYGGDDIVTRPYIMPEERSVDINSRLDFLVAESALKYLSKQKRAR